MMLILLLSLNVLVLNAQEFPDYYDKYVNDFANIFNTTETQLLRILLSEVEQNTTVEVVIVTINSTQPLTPAEYRTKLFNSWHIGKKDKDNGLLILYSVQENRIEVETGYGLEGVLPDSKLGRILDEEYVPYRDKKQINHGIISFTGKISRIINENKNELLSEHEEKWNFKVLSLIVSFLPFIILIFLICLIIIAVKKNKIKCDKDGLTMKSFGLIGGYYVYKCAKGHVHNVKKSDHYGGGFFGGIGGGSSGGFGGFGGGSSGGGGVGR